MLAQLPSLGVSGLLFVMWWFERQERTKGGQQARDAVEYARRTADVSRQLIDVVRANTDALAALREELRSQRGFQTEWLSRLTQQLERLAPRG
ncbi:MAG: hypothetical protein LC135_08125 [Phycisphaerae bacterium]|nr:hypothetical protein [Phycisphaerae bacterium]MCZ2399821.1 hypothetical protein [Phycisphaerae bacterium]